MSLSVGIVGLANVGKSTLFNALLKHQQALAANYPFATIEPNVGVVPVPDKRLDKLAKVTKESEGLEGLPPVVPATVTFVDIAGLVKGAHKGEGLGNKFLAHIREVDLMCLVLRSFDDGDVVETGSGDPKEDLETLKTELLLADLSTLEKQKEPKGSLNDEEKHRWEGILKLKEGLSAGKSAREIEMTEEEREATKELFLLTSKEEVVIFNVGENDIRGEKEERVESGGVRISAKMESELAGFDEKERSEYLIEMGIKESGLDSLIKLAYKKLGLLSFLTAGEKEVRAWTTKKGARAPEAAGVIHSDFEKNFIKAKVVSFDDFLKFNGLKGASEAGKLRLEGKDYVVQEGDVVEFMVGK
jgi:ribosome-binding ATPase